MRRSRLGMPRKTVLFRQARVPPVLVDPSEAKAARKIWASQWTLAPVTQSFLSHKRSAVCGRMSFQAILMDLPGLKSRLGLLDSDQERLSECSVNGQGSRRSRYAQCRHAN